MTYIPPSVECDNPVCAQITPADKGYQVPPQDAGWLQLWRYERRAVLDGEMIPYEMCDVASHVIRKSYDFCSAECLEAWLKAQKPLTVVA
jgi:hypothetical protein